MQALFYTLGCKVNQYETQAMMRCMAENGYDTGEYLPGSPDIGDGVIVLNSCTVTGESDRKLRQILHRCRRENPCAVLVLTGCMPQAFPEEAAGFDEADIVLGNAARAALPRYVGRFLELGRRIVDIPAHGKTFENLSIDAFQGRTRAFVKIEDGCDRFCAYCVIPRARGRVRSKPLDALQSELQALAARGYREIVLVGINLTAYGKDTGADLCDAVEAACAVDGIDRVRLGSLEPDCLTPAVIDRLASPACAGLCPQFHLSLQSGCDATLSRMRRRYTTDEYRQVCQHLRAAFPGCALTTDVMVGFPGESQAEFELSRRFVEEIGFARVHVFAYSRRAGTPAATAPGQISRAEKARRAALMSAAAAAGRDAFAAAHVGRTVAVLVETREDAGDALGYTPDYLPVRIQAAGDRLPEPGVIFNVRLTGASAGVCTGVPEP